MDWFACIGQMQCCSQVKSMPHIASPREYLISLFQNAHRYLLLFVTPVSRTKHVWYSEHGMYCRFEIILERAMSATHIAVILHTRTSPAYEEEFTKMDYPDARNGYGTS